MREPAAVLRRFRASNAEIERAAAVARGPGAPDGDGDVAARRWLAQVGDAADDLLRWQLLRTGEPAPWANAVAEIRARGEPLRREDLALRGGDLVDLGLRGPEVGRMLDLMLARVLDDPALNTRDALLALVQAAR